MIITLTVNPSVDASSSVKHVVPDDKLRCQKASYEAGGGGINVSRAIHRLGGETLALYTSGGLYGKMLEQLLAKEGVRQMPIPVTGLTRENLIVLEEASGQQFRFDMTGPRLREDEWQACLDQLSSIAPVPTFIVASGSLPPGVPVDFYARVAAIAKERNVRVIVDTSGEALRVALRTGVYLLKPNMRELQELSQQAIKTEQGLIDVANKLIEEKSCDVIVVSLGAGGALMVSKEGHEHFHSPVVPIISKVGAGDSMVAGIVLSLDQGKSLKDSVRFGVATGAAAVMNPQRELCRRQDAEDMFKRMTTEQ